MSYDLTPIRAPRAAGALLKLLNLLMDTPGVRTMLGQKLLADAGILQMRQSPSEEPLPLSHPVFGASGTKGEMPSAEAIVASARSREGFRFLSSADFAQAYSSGTTTPLAVAESLLSFARECESRSPAMRIFIAQDAEDLLSQARESSARWQRGAPLSVLDGVPVPVKDELDQRGYPTTVGTKFLGKHPALEDATSVARLRAAGALLVGKTNMHEIGMGVTGLNPNHGSARNPYDPARMTGGSSSGSAAAVAAGFGPFAVGADGGGSIRIPAALCGLVGLKPTYARVSEHGAAPLCWSVAHIGPIAGSVVDAALAYSFMAGPDPRDPNTLHQPPPHLANFAETSLSGVRIGVYKPWFEHASPGVVAACRAQIEALVERGARIVEVEIPELSLLRTVHLVSIIGEMASSHLSLYEPHKKDYGADTRLNIALARQFRAVDYVHAQRLRLRLGRHFTEALEKCDVLATPTTGISAALLPQDALQSGESNLPLIDEIMRFAPAANLTGLPAISVPAGYDTNGMPVGLQFMGRAWEEHLLLQLGRAVEDNVGLQRPAVYRNLLEG